MLLLEDENGESKKVKVKVQVRLSKRDGRLIAKDGRSEHWI